jgi:hypothetical protein
VEELRSELQRKAGTQELLKRLEHLEHTKAEVSEVDHCPCALWKPHLQCAGCQAAFVTTSGLCLGLGMLHLRDDSHALPSSVVTSSLRDAVRADGLRAIGLFVFDR